MLDCLEQNPRRRPSAQQIIERLKKIPVSPREHAPALPPNMLRPSTPAEAAAEAAARAKVAAVTATAAAVQATVAAELAPADQQAQQRGQEHATQRWPEQQQGERQGRGDAAALGLSPVLASDPGSPGIQSSPSAVSAFAAAAAAPAGTSTPTPRTASNASELLSGQASGWLPSPLALPSGFAGAAIAPAGSLPTPFSSKALAASALLDATLEQELEPSSGGGTHLPAWSSSDELGSRDPRSSFEQRSSLELSRAASGAHQGPAAQAAGAPARPAGVSLGRRGSILLPPAAAASGKASPRAAGGGSPSQPAAD